MHDHSSLLSLGLFSSSLICAASVDGPPMAAPNIAGARKGCRRQPGSTKRQTDPGQIAGRGAVEQMQLDDLRVVELLERHNALDEELRRQTVRGERLRTG